jgi:membrane-associated phospholipid phosphatase
MTTATPARRAGVAAAILGLLIPIGIGLRALARIAAGPDHRVVADAVASRSDTLTSAAHAASVLGRSWVLILATVVLGLGLVSRIRWRAFGPLVAVLGAEVLQHAIKALIQRPRPLVPRLEHVAGSSFPSGHATESTAVALALVLLVGRRPRRERIAAALTATLLVAAIAASRVYLGVHYPTDVAAGITLGAAWGATAAWCTTSGNGDSNSARPQRLLEARDDTTAVSGRQTPRQRPAAARATRRG